VCALSASGGHAATVAVGEDAVVAERNAGFVVRVFFNAAIVFVILVFFAAAIVVLVVVSLSDRRLRRPHCIKLLVSVPACGAETLR